MKKLLEKITIITIHIFCLFAIIELGVNYFSFYYLFPIKNANSFGYIERKTNKTIIPLDKYSTRLKAQLALPYELIISKISSSKELVVSYDENTKKYGYKDTSNKLIIEYNFDEAQNFKNDYAIVAISKNNEKKFGTIDKKGKWIIEPKYSYLCPFMKYHTKACIDDKHCGVIDRYGNEVTLMSYTTDKLNCTGANCGAKLCAISKNKDASCNYFL